MQPDRQDGVAAPDLRSVGVHASPEEWDEWIRLFANRDEIADAYAGLLRTEAADWIGWPEINAALLRRWSPAGVRYIKEKAWKIAAA